MGRLRQNSAEELADMRLRQEVMTLVEKERDEAKAQHDALYLAVKEEVERISPGRLRSRLEAILESEGSKCGTPDA